MLKISKPFHTLKIQLLLIFLALATIPSLIIGLIAGKIIYQNGIRTNMDYAQKSTEIITTNIDTFTERCLEYAEMVSTDNQIQEVLRRPLSESLEERYRIELEISQLLYFYNHAVMDEIFGIYVIGANGLQCNSNSMPYKSTSLNDSTLYKQIENTSGPIWSANHGDSSVTKVTDKDFYSAGLRIVDKANGSVIGIVVIEFEDTYFSKLTDTTYNANDNMFYIKDNTGFYYTSNDSAEKINIEEGKVYTKGGTDYFTSETNGSYIYTEADFDTGFKLISLVSSDEIIRNCLSLTKSIILFTFLLTVLSTTLFIYINSKIFGPMQELKKGIELVQDGHYDAALTTTSKNEIGILVNGFNNMIGTINTQMDNIYRHQRNLRKAHLEVLQAQINPHFLYNTLDSIIWLSRARDTDSTITLTGALIKFLRIGLSNGFKTITIEDELNHVENYLQIQKIRYGSLLNYSVGHPAEASGYYIPKLTLQPLVENSISHGMDTSHSIGLITVTCEITEDKILILVEDTGVGIDAETLEKINHMEYSPASGGIGIKNVNERLQLYYHVSYRMWLTSTPGRGTTVHIELPKETEVRND